MPCTGASGTWTLAYEFSGQTFTITLSGYADDSPYYQSVGSGGGCSNRGHVYSSCDGRIMRDTLTCNASISNFRIIGFEYDNPDETPHDCINGVCVPSFESGQSGIFATKADCELTCGQNQPGLVCMTNEEYGVVKNLINRIRGQACD